MQIITGHTGELHVTSVDDSVRNVMLGKFGEKVVLPIYEEFEARAITANIVRVYSGYGMNQGRLFRVDRNTYDEVIIENGTAGMKRADLIVARYEQNEGTGVESIVLTAIRGETGNAYVDPTYNTGDLMEGDLIDDMPLYRVKINGIVIEALEPLFAVYDALDIINKKVDTKVDKVAGKGLSANDFSNSYKSKLENIDNVAFVSIAASDWSTSTTTISGRSWYTCKKTFSKIYQKSIQIAPSGEAIGILPTEIHETAWLKIRAVADDSDNSITFYSESKPVVTLYCEVGGCI